MSNKDSPGQAYNGAELLVRRKLDVAARKLTTTSAEEARAEASLPPARELTAEEARIIFDQEARRCPGLTGEEFIRAWDAGEFDDDPDRPEVMGVAMLLPLVR